jgi:hypothetical protein
MTDHVLSRRELNRTLIARQMLLKRMRLPVPDAIERLVGLQAQIPNPPYIGLWTRLADFRRDDLTRLMEQRQIVRAAMMRSTLHLVTAEDHQRFRPTLQPALTRALSAFFGKRAKGLDVAKLVEVARSYVEAAPRTTGDLRRRLSVLEPDRDPDALAYAVRTYLPLVQVPPSGTWGSGSSAIYITADAWLGQLEPSKELRSLLFRYLAAFGPATVMDFQTWAGMVKLKDDVEQLKPELCIVRDEQGKELLDLPDMPLLAGDTPAPPRFLPEYDNLVLSHADRTRVIADEYRSSVFLTAGRVRATFLIDGFVQGAWKIERDKERARLVIEPFAPLTETDRAVLVQEGEQLVRFVEDDATTFNVTFAEKAEQR